MRVNPFARLERQGNYVVGDCSYINDFGSEVFERVCQLDSATSNEMIKAGVAGYEEGKYGEIHSHTGYLGNTVWAQVGNKDFVALWVEGSALVSDDVVVIGIYNHDGKYYLTKCYIFKLIAALKSKPHLHISDRMKLGIHAAVGI